MRFASHIALGVCLLFAGAAMLAGRSPVRNPLMHAAVVVFDMKERQCRTAPVALGSPCPAGCEARPARSEKERAAPPACHSRLWAATCGRACDPGSGYARLPDGRLVDGRRMRVVLEREPGEAFEKALASMRVTLSPRFDGLYRYDAVLADDASFEKTKKRLAALPGVQSVEVILK